MLETGAIRAARELGRYRAFVSYSHVDAAVARWLHRALERYRAPTGLRSTKRSERDRLYPIFRDREELPASSDLSAGIIDALTRSDALIVICSPDAAESKWVDQEIRTFKSLQPGAPVLALIAAGEPRASEPGGPPGQECFPLALRRDIRADGSLGDTIQEPIAADLRPGGDGKRLARLKIAAGVLGVPVGALVRRDEERQRRWLLAVIAAAAALILVLGGLLYRAWSADRRAAAIHNEAEGLVEYLLGDLRKQLEPIGKLAIMDSLGNRVLAYYRQQSESDLTPDALSRRARVLTMLGEIQSKRGDLDKALGYYKQAEASTGELLRRDPSNGQRIFDYAQSVYWVGNIDWQRGNGNGAAGWFEKYRRLAERLVAIDPANQDWRAEVGYAYSNLGTLFFEEGRYPEAASALRKSLLVSRQLAAHKPDDVELQISLAQSYGWVADAAERLGQIGKAIRDREAEARIYDTLLLKGEDTRIRQYRITAERVLSRLADEAGNRPLALERGRRAASAADLLRQIDSSNMNWVALAVQTDLNLSNIQLEAADVAGAEVSLQRALRYLDWLTAKGGSVVRWQNLYIASQVSGAEIALARGHYDVALEMATTADMAVGRLPVSQRMHGEGAWYRARARLAAAEAALSMGAHERAREAMNIAAETLRSANEPRFRALQLKLNNLRQIR